MRNLIVSTYIVYFALAIALTFIVARIFFKNSKIFMLNIFNGREEIALSTNKLFEVGFYLLNLGFALFYMKINRALSGYSSREMFETLSYKVGSLAVFLGLMVFFNLYMLFRGKKRSKVKNQINQVDLNQPS